MTTGQPGLREKKKDATRKALRDAALRLALAHGPDNVRVDDIAEAAGVSPRTYNNYFSSREQAIVAAVTADREARVAAAVAARPADVPLSAAVIEAVVAQYAGSGDQDRDHDVLSLIAARPALRDAFLDATADIADPLAVVIASRLGEHNPEAAEVLAAGVAAAIRIALKRWIQPANAGLVVVSGSLSDLLVAALTPLAPALDVRLTRR